ncbi:MAG TPA: hypothetical protein VHF51_05480 [Solirubrobacteraceae bacterium]|nr:hypothetical protein [Solirubrobacteraceae bacterium]
MQSDLRPTTNTGPQLFIVRGIDSGHGFVGHDRAESIQEYHRQIADTKAQIARCERFLALVESYDAARQGRL